MIGFVMTTNLSQLKIAQLRSKNKRTSLTINSWNYLALLRPPSPLKPPRPHWILLVTYFSGAGQSPIKSGPHIYAAAAGSKIFSAMTGHQVATPTLQLSTSGAEGQSCSLKRSIIFGTASPVMCPKPMLTFSKQKVQSSSLCWENNWQISHRDRARVAPFLAGPANYSNK